MDSTLDFGAEGLGIHILAFARENNLIYHEKEARLALGPQYPTFKLFGLL